MRGLPGTSTSNVGAAEVAKAMAGGLNAAEAVGVVCQAANSVSQVRVTSRLAAVNERARLFSNHPPSRTCSRLVLLYWSVTHDRVVPLPRERMPVLEVTQLRLKGLAAHDPALLHSLSTVRAKLHTSSRFYNCIDDPSLVYILGIWPSLDAHVDFLASPSRDEILGPQEDLLQFCWTVHVEMGGIDLLPLDAPILAIERIRVSEECTGALDQAIQKHIQELRGSHLFKIATGWRCDAEPTTHEVLIFSGCQTAQAHVGFTVKSHHSGQYETIEIMRCRDLERIGD